MQPSELNFTNDFEISREIVGLNILISKLQAPCIFNQGRQITKIEIDFESESKECVCMRVCVKRQKNEGK